VSGLAFDTALRFPELASGCSTPEVGLSVSDGCAFHWPVGTEWGHRASLPDGRAWPAFGRYPAGYVLDFEHVCGFLISEGGSKVTAVPKPGIRASAVQRLFLDQVIPLLLHLKGRECLHASAVLTPNGACALLGPSGAGKSTLAAKLALAGHALLSDDCLAIQESAGEILVLPGNRGSKLWPDSAEALLTPATRLPGVAGYEAKRLLASDRTADQPAPLRRIYILTPLPLGAPVRIVPATPQETIPALLEAAFRLDLHDTNLLSRQFQFLLQVAAKVPIRQLIYPQDFGALPEVCARILEDAAL
jgi:hypothetical protein